MKERAIFFPFSLGLSLPQRLFNACCGGVILGLLAVPAAARELYRSTLGSFFVSHTVLMHCVCALCTLCMAVVVFRARHVCSGQALSPLPRAGMCTQQSYQLPRLPTLLFCGADLVSDVANGGQILMDENTFRLVKDCLSVLGTVTETGFDNKVVQQLMQAQVLGKHKWHACNACVRWVDRSCGLS